MKKYAIGIIFSIILTLCFYNVQAESEQVENEIVAEVQNGAKENLARSAEENGIQPYAEDTIYRDIDIVGNRGNNNFIGFILGSHETEKVKVIATNTLGQNVNNPDVEFSTEDTSIATVDNTGTIKAKKVGKTDLIVSGGGCTGRATIEVYPAFEFSDFTNAKVETVNPSFNIEQIGNFTYDIKDIIISGITNLNSDTYYGIITTNNTKPENLCDDVGVLDYDAMKNKYNILIGKIENNNILKYSGVELTNLNLSDSEEYYLWIYQKAASDNFKGYYHNENGQEIRCSGKYVLEAKKVDLKVKKVNVSDRKTIRFNNSKIRLNSSTRKNFT